MAELSSFHIFASGRALRRPAALSRHVAAAAGELLLFLWTAVALAFSLVVIAGFFL
ncbi:MAG TPA: hypothetical protein VNZ53_37310 [Steroidobacteraceae bacterium]|jgi:hypothetical protein|nr:hypothetical protein [Steroidobacteraceae bacterium]